MIKHIKNNAVFLGLVVLCLIIWLANLNQSLFLSINAAHEIVPVFVWRAINYVCYPRIPLLSIILLVVTYIYHRDKILNVLFLIISFYLVFALAKYGFGESRPYVVLPPNQFFFDDFAENSIKSANNSFPSGHVGNIAIFVFALGGLFFKSRPVVRTSLIGVIFLVALARICTGWHWPLDVLVSGLLAYVLAKVFLSIKFKRNKG